MVHNIESLTDIKMDLLSDISNEDIIPLLNPIAKAMKVAQLRLMEVGFDEKAEIFDARKKINNRKMLRKSNNSSISTSK